MCFSQNSKPGIHADSANGFKPLYHGDVNKYGLCVCSETQYEAEMSLGIWPSEASMNKTVSKFNQLPPDFFKNTDNSTAYIRFLIVVTTTVYTYTVLKLNCYKSVLTYVVLYTVYTVRKLLPFYDALLLPLLDDVNIRLDL
jgi:hypothetical protein